MSISFTPFPSRPKAPRGFTLIEVMIVVAIVAILASVALPSYNDYIRRGQLPEAFTFLSDYRIKMEQYYQDNRFYGTGTDCAKNGGAGPTWSSFAPEGIQRFQITCTLTPGGQGYTLQAEGISGQAKDHIYTINESNQRRTTKFKNAASTATCWLVKGNECT